MDLGLAGKSCLVTGAGRGIGLEVAKHLCAEGASVLLVARDGERLNSVVEQCRTRGGAAETLALDITTTGAAEQMVEASEQTFGQLDVIVNNAGAAQWRTLEQVPDEDWHAAWELNVMAPMRLMRAALPAMAKRGWGRVVNVSSSSGKRPSQMLPEYSVAKAAQLSLSRLFADHQAGSGVLVNAVCPGGTSSEMWMGPGELLDQLAEASDSSREQAAGANAAKSPVGRMAEVDEIAAVITFLCSERASFVAGAAWGVDGGAVQAIV